MRCSCKHWVFSLDIEHSPLVHLAISIFKLWLNGEVGESTISPRGSPGVLDLPVLLSIVGDSLDFLLDIPEAEIWIVIHGVLIWRASTSISPSSVDNNLSLVIWIVLSHEIDSNNSHSVIDLGWVRGAVPISILDKSRRVWEDAICNSEVSSNWSVINHSEHVSLIP